MVSKVFGLEGTALNPTTLLGTRTIKIMKL